MLEEFIAQRVVELWDRDLSAQTRQILKRNLIDSYAGICASLLDYPLVEKFKRYSDFSPDENGLTAWGTGQKVQLVHGVFMNTILGRRSDLVNTYLSPNRMGGNHPSDNVSLILSLTDWKKTGGEELIRLMHLAYVLSCAYSDYAAAAALNPILSLLVLRFTLSLGCALPKGSTSRNPASMQSI